MATETSESGNLESGNIDNLEEKDKEMSFEIIDGEIWLPRKDVQKLLGISHETVKKACRQGRYRSRKFKKRGGTAYYIALSSLPPDAQLSWVKQNPQAAQALPEYLRAKLSPQAQWEILKLTAPREEIGHILLNPKYKKKVASMLPVIEEALAVYKSSLPFGEKSHKITEIARRHGLAKSTLYLWLKRYLEGGVAALVKPRTKEPSAWDPEALELLKGAYLKLIRETGKGNKRLAYRIAVEEAKKRGLSVGSERSAYTYLAQLSSDVLAYARGGSRAVKKRVVVFREWDLLPNEEWVGDQHRFNYFVQDKKTGRVFRAEGFLWEDSQTRLLTGIALAVFPHFRNYDAWLVGLALKMGVMAFGLPKRIYTDWGRPERSQYLRQVMEDLAAVPGMKPAWLAEKFRVDDGYAIVDKDGNVIEVVATPAAWHRRMEKLSKLHKLAEPYNPQTKLVERTFQTLEGILLELGVPGRVRDIRKESADEKLLRSRELQRLAESGKLLSPQEFMERVFEAVEIYNRRPHSTLNGRSPLEVYQEFASSGRFSPVFIGEDDARFIFSARDWRTVDRGHIRLGKELYEARALREVPDGTRVEVRFDVAEGWVCAVWWEKEVAIELAMVKKVSQRTGEGLVERLREKEEVARLTREYYRRLTTQVPKVVSYSKFTRIAKRMRKLSAEEEYKLSEREFERAVAEAEQRQKAPKNVVPLPVLNLPAEPVERYAALLEVWEQTGSVPKSEVAFMRSFEEGLSEREREYWNFMREFKGLPPIGEFGEAKKSTG